MKSAYPLFLLLLLLVAGLSSPLAQAESVTDKKTASTAGRISPALPEVGPSIPELFKKVSPTVVVIQTVGKKFSQKIKDGKAELESVYGLGSGVLISDDGKVITAAHVVHTADVVAVKFQNEEKVAARVIGSAPSADIAILQLEKVPEGYAPAVLGNSDQAKIGEHVMVIGAPYGLSKTMTIGYISGRISPDEKLTGDSRVELFQSDAAVNTGNSGGPMFSMQGEVIGIVSSILSRSGGFEGISFAVTSNTAKALLIDQPSFWMGVESLILTSDMAKVFNVPQGTGVLIQRVAEGSLGHRLDLKPGFMPIQLAGREVIVGGDIVVEIMGQPVPGTREEFTAYFEKLRNKVGEMKPDDQIVIQVLRDGKIIELTAPVEAPPRQP